MIAKVRWVNLISFLGFILGIVCILVPTIFRNHCRAKKCLLSLVKDWQTSLTHCFNHLELKNLSNLFTVCFRKNERIMRFISEPKLLCKCCASDYSIINHSSSSSNDQSNVYHPNIPRDYCRLIYYVALDSLVTLKESLQLL